MLTLCNDLLSLFEAESDKGLTMAIRKRRIFLAESSPSIRKSLRQLLAAESDLEVVGEASDGLELVNLAEIHRPDIVMMELSLPELDGLQAIRFFVKRRVKFRVLALTVHSDPEYVRAAFEAGAQGYLDKDASIDLIIPAIRSVLAGNRFLPPHLAQHSVQLG